MDSEGFLKPWKICFMSENQISDLDFALFALFNVCLLYLGGGEPVLTPNIPVADTCKELVHILAPNNWEKFNFYDFLWL